MQVRLLEKLLNDEITGRMRANQMQAKLFSEEVRAVLHRYELKQLTSAEVVERLVEIAKQLRDARHRHEQLGLSEEEAAFYDALAGGVEDVKADPELAKIAHELVEGIRTDLTVDWADREATEARIRAKIKRLLRKHKYQPPKPRPDGGGGGDLRRLRLRGPARARPSEGAVPLLARCRGRRPAIPLTSRHPVPERVQPPQFSSRLLIVTRRFKAHTITSPRRGRFANCFRQILLHRVQAFVGAGPGSAIRRRAAWSVAALNSGSFRSTNRIIPPPALAMRAPSGLRAPRARTGTRGAQGEPAPRTAPPRARCRRP